MEETDQDVVVPDVIEPIIAYKHLMLLDKELLGPGFSTVPGVDRDLALWVPGQVKEARCVVEGCTESPCSPQRIRRDAIEHEMRQIATIVKDITGHEMVHETIGLRRQLHIVGNGCGIYAYKTQDQVVAAHKMPFAVLATIEVWGKVYEYQAGWRGQFARLVDAELLEPTEQVWEVYGMPHKGWKRKRYMNRLQSSLNAAMTPPKG